MPLDADEKTYLAEQGEREAVATETVEPSETVEAEVEQPQPAEAEAEAKKESGLVRFFRKLFEF